MFFAALATLLFIGLTDGQKEVPILPVCATNEEFRECGTACQVTCRTLFQDQNQPCSDVCVSGCFCKQGYVRAIEDGPCVSEIMCRLIRPIPPMLVCGENEILSACGASCPATCQDKGPKVCAEVCREGCACKEGYVRSTKEGPCIPLDGCKVAV